jgi:hypothetical protein
MAEYAPILALIAFTVFFSVAFLGPWVANNIGVAGLSVEYGGYAVGECPSGDWGMKNVTTQSTIPKKNGQEVNANGDDFICDKDIPGGGNGNTDKNHDVKDNNSQPWDNG